MKAYIVKTNKSREIKGALNPQKIKLNGCAAESVKWQISQIKNLTTEDIFDTGNFTCVEFNESGDLLATGDKSGRVTVFRVDKNTGLYDIYCAFTSHEPEFDYLKSLEIEEKINSVTWLPNYTSAHHLLSANDKTIKLWRLSERHHEAYNFNIRSDENCELWSDANFSQSETIGPPIPQFTCASKLRVPKFRKTRHLTVEARPRRVFANAHAYLINAVSVNSDQETFLSADDLRINLWHLDVSNQSFTIVDLKPSNMEDLAEVITCARFHPQQCHLLAYSTSRGVIRLCDMRHRALCDNHVLVYEDPCLSQNLGFFSDIIASLSDFRFGYSGNYLLARDYLTLKVWDMRMGDRPCEIYSVHEPLRSQLCLLYENDAIFDKFLCSWSCDDRYALTGSYGNVFHIFDRHTGSDWLYDLNDPSTSQDGNSSEVVNYLAPKRFLSPEDSMGSQLGISSIYVAPLEAVESLFSEITSHTSSRSSCSELEKSDDSPESKHWSDISNQNLVSPLLLDSVTPVTPPTGSKRRKQILPSRSSSLDDPSNHSKSEANHRHKSKHRSRKRSTHPQECIKSSENGHNTNGSHTISINDSATDVKVNNSTTVRRITVKDIVSGKAVLPGMHQLDCQRKLLHLSWHPHKLLTAAVSGNQLFVVSGESKLLQASSINTSAFKSSQGSGEANIVCTDYVSSSEQKEISEDMFNSDNLNNTLNSSADVKAAKRRRRRHYISDDSDTDLQSNVTKDSDNSVRITFDKDKIPTTIDVESSLTLNMDCSPCEVVKEDDKQDLVNSLP